MTCSHVLQLLPIFLHDKILQKYALPLHLLLFNDPIPSLFKKRPCCDGSMGNNLFSLDSLLQPVTDGGCYALSLIVLVDIQPRNKRGILSFIPNDDQRAAGKKIAVQEMALDDPKLVELLGAEARGHRCGPRKSDPGT